MATPPTFVAEYESVWNDATTPKTASVTVAAGDTLCVVAVVENSDGTLNTPTGGGLTYTLQQSITITDYCTLYVWTAKPSTSQTYTLSLTRNGLSVWWGFNTLRYSGSDGVGASAKANITSGAPSLALTTTTDNAAIVVVNGDWNAADGASRTWRTVNGITPTSGNGMERTYFRDPAHYTVYGAYYSDAGTAGAKTVGLSAPTGQKYAIVAVEIKGTAGGVGRTVAVGQAVETDTATAVTRRKARTVAQATEADSATPVGRAKVRAVAQAAEADTAQPVGRLKRRAVSGPTETDLAQPTTRIKTRTIGQPAEVDAAQPIGRRKVRLLGQAVETDLAQPVGSAGNRIVAVGQAAEVDTAATMGRAKTRAVGQPVETDSALALARLKVRTVAGVAEVDAANPVTPAKARILGLAVEADTATPLARSKVRTIGQAVETDTATALLGAGPRVVARGKPTLTSATATVGLAATGSTARLVPRSEVRLR